MTAFLGRYKQAACMHRAGAGKKLGSRGAPRAPSMALPADPGSGRVLSESVGDRVR